MPDEGPYYLHKCACCGIAFKAIVAFVETDDDGQEREVILNLCSRCEWELFRKENGTMRLPPYNVVHPLYAYAPKKDTHEHK